MITRGISNGEESTLIDAEPSTFPLPNNLPPQAADITCLLLPSHSLSNSVSYNDRSRANSHSSINDQNERQIII
jgi:hypothetical protein